MSPAASAQVTAPADTATEVLGAVKRAQSVADVLVSVGMKPANLEIHGRGETMPLADNKTREGRAANRRVAIVISDQ